MPCLKREESRLKFAAPFEIVRSPVLDVAKPAAATATILLVEDETAIRELAGAYLQGNGYHVLEAADGEEAIMLWEKHGAGVDLVLTDLMIPGGVDGYTLVRRLQAERPSLKAIFVSGRGADSFEHETTLDAATNFLPKPYRLKSLATMVHDCLLRADAV